VVDSKLVGEEDRKKLLLVMMHLLMMLMVPQLRSMALLLMMLMVLPQRPLVTMMTMKQVVLMTPMVLQLRNMVPLLMRLMVPQLRNMVPLLMMLMVPPQKDLLTMMTMLPEMFLLMLMLLLRLPLLMRMLDVAVTAEDLAALLPDLTEEKLSVVDVPGALERLTGAHLLSGRHQGLDVTRGPPPGGNKSRDADVDSSPSQSHTEDQGGTPLLSDIRDKRLNSKAD